MPYLRYQDRMFTDEYGPRDAGSLNYAITRLVQKYIADQGGASYALYNEVIGALESAKLEFYRRAIAPYEDAKAATNGDVYA